MKLRSYWDILKESASHASKDKIPKLSAALAYYTVFSLPALLLVITGAVNFFLRDQGVEARLFSDLGAMIGPDTAKGIQESLNKTDVVGNTTLATVGGIIMLLVGATGIFNEMQDSLNHIFGVQANPKLGLMSMIISRLASFGMLVSLGFLLLVSLLFTALLSVLMEKFKAMFPDVTVYLAMLIDLIFSLSLITLLFALIFKLLPDVRIGWKDVFRGALFTAVLFMAGKVAIAFYLGKSSLSTTYGAAGSIIILLAWVYYSSILLYFGAEFTRSSAVKYGKGIRPNKFAEWLDCNNDKALQ